MLVVYRMTSIPSSNPSPFPGDKNTLNATCLRSFVSAFKDTYPYIVFLFDHCDKEMYSQVESIVPFEYEIIESRDGINATMLKSYEIASMNQGAVLFQECDYLYRKDLIGKVFEKAVYELGIVSPYDHPNFYRDTELHKPECRIQLIENTHFRTTERNTMTWATTAEIVRENIDILNRHGYLDGPVWYELKEKGHDLWVPIPSFATHCVENCLSPSIDWKTEWSNA